MEERRCIVQFLHPGPERRPDKRGSCAWTSSDLRHARKFMRCGGQYLEDGTLRTAEIVFWGEWEADSTAREIGTGVTGPRWVHTLMYQPRQNYRGLNNTDPFVFGGFYYSICQMYADGSPTQMRYLESGSVILFGSCVAREFRLDTVFVVARRIEYRAATFLRELADQGVSGCCVDIAVAPLHGEVTPGCSSDDEPCLYIGATFEKPFEGMYSFFPCLPAETAPKGFERPRVSGSFITQGLNQSRFQVNLRNVAEARERWEDVREQVRLGSLCLGVRADAPPLGAVRA